jgi:hypothetical protein
MENFDNILAGLFLFIITSVLAYLFRMRQLYVVTSKLFRHASISKDGSLCELIVYNNGNQVEENIKVNLNPELKAELLACSSKDIKFNDSIMEIDRLHKGCEASAILLIENGVLSYEGISSISSKGTNGTVCKSMPDVHPNYAKFFLGFALFVGFFLALFSEYDKKIYHLIKDPYVEYQLNSIYKKGWSNLENYYDSKLRESYSNNEFPIKLVKADNNNQGGKAEFEVYNKTALPLTVFADDAKAKIPADFNAFADSAPSPYFAYTELPPMSKKSFTVNIPHPTGNPAQSNLKFSLNTGSEHLHDIRFSLEANN